MSAIRNSQGSYRARNRRIAFKTTRRVNAELDMMAKALGLSRSGAAHWACLVWGGLFAQNSQTATDALLGGVFSLGCEEDWLELINHVRNLPIDNPPWEA